MSNIAHGRILFPTNPKYLHPCRPWVKSVALNERPWMAELGSVHGCVSCGCVSWPIFAVYSHQLRIEGLSVMLGWKIFAAKACSYRESRSGQRKPLWWLTLTLVLNHSRLKPTKANSCRKSWES